MLRKILSGIVLLVLLLGFNFVGIQAATEDEVLTAIDLGISWLAGSTRIYG